MLSGAGPVTVSPKDAVTVRPLVSLAFTEIVDEPGAVALPENEAPAKVIPAGSPETVKV